MYSVGKQSTVQCGEEPTQNTLTKCNAQSYIFPHSTGYQGGICLESSSLNGE